MQDAPSTSWSDLASEVLLAASMMKRAALLMTALLTCATASAYADDDRDGVPPVTTTTAGTLVVVTPNAPVTRDEWPGGSRGHADRAAFCGHRDRAAGRAQSPPAPPAAPQNENWDNVSHINGSIVPVGERNQYLYAYKKNNLQSRPARVDVRLLPDRRFARAVG